MVFRQRGANKFYYFINSKSQDQIKMSYNKASVVLLLSLIAFTSALSLSGQKQYNANQYENALLQEQQQFAVKVDEVKSQIEEVRRVFDNATITSNVKLVRVSEGMAEQRNTLYDMQQILKLPFELRECRCANISQQARDKVNNKIQELSQSVAGLRGSLKKCDEERCPRYEQLALELSQSQNYLAIMNETINAQCCKANFKFVAENATGLVNLQGTIYKDNLNVKNWFYGDVDQKEYILKRFELATKYNLTSCPLEKPFADLVENICIQCLSKDQYFNLGSRKCVACEKSARVYFNVTSGQCLQCPVGSFYNAVRLRCESCPAGMIYDNSTQKCRPCGVNQFVNETTQTCQNCSSPEQIYNNKTRQCQGCNTTAGDFLNKATMKCQPCPVGLFFDTKSGKCAHCPIHSHFNKTTGQCVSCPVGLVWVRENNTCTVCPNGTHYNTKTFLCSSCPKGTVYDNESSICVDSTIGNSSNCPKSKPYYNKYKKVCEQCDFNEVLDEETNSCKPSDTFSVCPPEKPIYNELTLGCIPCPTGSTYDPQIHHCTSSKCQEGEYVDAVTNACTRMGNCKNQQFFDTSLRKCIVSHCNINQIYDKATNSCTLISKVCAQNGTSYDLETNKCIPKCPEGSFYSKASNKCQKNQDSQSLGKCKKDETYMKDIDVCVKTWTTCGAGHYYDSQQMKCLATRYITSPFSLNLLYQYKPFKDYQAEYETKIAQASKVPGSLSDCPQSHPYYDPASRGCIKCEGQSNLFNLETNRCSKCKDGFVYVASKHQCVAA